MGFRNPILGGGGALVRPAIKSPNYQPAVDGWIVRRDGTAEFADMTIRSSDGSGSNVAIANGEIEIRDGAGVLVIEVNAAGYKLYDGANLVAEIRLDGSGGGGMWTRNFIFPAPTYSFLRGGEIEFATVDPSLVDIRSYIRYLTNASSYSDLIFRSGIVDSAGNQQCSLSLSSPGGGARPIATLYGDGLSDPADLDVKGRVWVGGRDIGSGVVGYAAITASTVTTTSSLDQVAITLGSRTYKANRAYRMRLKAFVSSTIANDEVGLRIRKTNATGTILTDVEATGTIHRASQNYMVEISNIVKVGAADVTAAMVATYFRRSGTGDVRVVASAVNPGFLEIEDVGDAADYPNATTLT